MSFIEQERALFDLLFDAELREKFLLSSTAALDNYQLSPAELDDFTAIRPDALAIDAEMRRSMILAQLTRSYPMSMALLSSMDNGLSSAKTWINPELMRTPPKQRPLLFGQVMANWLKQYSFASNAEKKLFISIQEAELSMAWTAANIDSPSAEVIEELAENWPQQPIRMAEHISAALLPLPYHELKKTLCPTADSQLWRHLNKHPLQVTTIEKLLQHTDQHLLVALACIEEQRFCDPQTHHRSLVLSEGFAPLFQHINGHNSVVEILMQLTQAGASNKIVHSVKSGFQQLLEQGMLKLL